MGNKGCLVLGALMLKKMSENFVSPGQNLQKFWRFWVSGGQMVKKCKLLLQKAHTCVNPRCLSHFAWSSVGGRALASSLRPVPGKNQCCLITIQDGGEPPVCICDKTHSAAIWDSFMKFCRNIHSHYPNRIIWQKSTPEVDSIWRRPPFWKHVG